MTNEWVTFGPLLSICRAGTCYRQRRSPVAAPDGEPGNRTEYTTT